MRTLFVCLSGELELPLPFIRTSYLRWWRMTLRQGQ